MTKLPKGWRPPLWGSFIYFADYDVLSFAVLWTARLFTPSMFHLAQATEKYLKALALSVADPDGKHATADSIGLKKSHDMVKLAARCASHYPYYGKARVQGHLHRFSEYNEATRYPWVKRKHDRGLSSKDIAVFDELIHHL